MARAAPAMKCRAGSLQVLVMAKINRKRRGRDLDQVRCFFGEAAAEVEVEVEEEVDRIGSNKQEGPTLCEFDLGMVRSKMDQGRVIAVGCPSGSAEEHLTTPMREADTAEDAIAPQKSARPSGTVCIREDWPLTEGTSSVGTKRSHCQAKWPHPEVSASVGRKRDTEMPLWCPRMQNYEVRES